jgi:hypothetical protein
MSVPVPVPMPVLMLMLMLMLALALVSMSAIMLVVVATVIVSFHPDHLTLVVPGPTYSSGGSWGVAPPHNIVKFG